MVNVVIITGGCAVGKDTIARLLKEEYKTFVSDTTRPKRNGERDGVEYNFLSEEMFFSKVINADYVETREYETEEGIWYYGLPTREVTKAFSQGGNYMVILDPQGAKTFIEYLYEVGEKSEMVITTVFLTASIETRLRRYMNRDSLTKQQYLEMFRRFLADEEEVEPYKEDYDIILKNEDENDIIKNIEIIKSLMK